MVGKSVVNPCWNSLLYRSFLKLLIFIYGWFRGAKLQNSGSADRGAFSWSFIGQMSTVFLFLLKNFCRLSVLPTHIIGHYINLCQLKIMGQSLFIILFIHSQEQRTYKKHNLNENLLEAIKLIN